MPQVVQADPGQPQPTELAVELAAELVRLVRPTVLAGEDQVLILVRGAEGELFFELSSAVALKLRDGRAVEGDDTPAAP